MTEPQTSTISVQDDNEEDFFFKPKKKHKILFLSDHPLATSGVGVQARFLINGLIDTGKYTFRCLGGAMKHSDYRTIQVNEDFIIQPVDGFGTKDMIRSILISEKPDAIFIFTDPRQFTWLWEMEDEIKQVCPIVYWHVWDNDPYPAFNRAWYEGTELINCLSHKTYELVKPNFPEKTNYIPHAFPKNVYFPLDKATRANVAAQQFGDKADWYKMLWVNRNATRKCPSDVMEAWRLFIDNLQAKHGHKRAVLIMHTDPKDPEGPDIIAVSQQLGIQDNVWFSVEKLQFEQMNVLHNIVDGVVNISKNEGFGLSTLTSLQVGKPIVALKTGGETRQVIDWRDGFEHGVAIEPCKRLLVGSQQVPYIYEDYAGTQDIVDAFMKIYEMTEEEKDAMEKRCVDYVDFEFNYNDMVNKWDTTMDTCITDYKNNNRNKYGRWTLQEVVSAGTRIDQPQAVMPKIIGPQEQFKMPQPSAQAIANDQALIEKKPMGLKKVTAQGVAQ